MTSARPVLRLVVVTLMVAASAARHNGACTVAAAEPLRIVTLGDSITKGVRPGVSNEQTFSSLLQAGLKQNGIHAKVTNVGIGGERTDQAIARLEKAVIAQAPHIVVIMYGTNDSYVDPKQTASRLTAEEYRTHLAAIVANLREAKAQPILMTEPAWAEDCKPNGLGEDPNVRLAPFMVVCREVAQATKTPLVDHFAHWNALAARGAKLQPLTTDGCHPNPQGHEVLAQRLLQTVLPLAQRLADEHRAWDDAAAFRVQLDTLSSGYDGKMCWVHPRAAALPTKPATVVLTMQKLLLTGSDVFYAINDLRSNDGGQTWGDAREHADSLGRRDEGEGVVVAACDFTPKWHAASGKLLGIGHTVRYFKNKVIENRPRETCFAVYDEAKQSWTPWTTLALPDDPQFANAGAGSVQRTDLPNGDILLPIYFRDRAEKYYRVTVLRCSFDGSKLKFVEQGNELTIESGRGLYEPSLTRFGKRFYLTMRNDTAGYVSVSDDGLHFGPHQRWNWDDESELGNYNTQQHWVTHTDGLYLAYTRRGAQNDHVFRNRAPLFIAQIDPERLCVIRNTERVLVPERGARLGNFGVVNVGPDETWVTVAEWMQTWPPQTILRPDNPYGANNSVFAARIRWSKPNEGWDQR